LIPSVVAEEQTFNSKAGFGFLCSSGQINHVTGQVMSAASDTA